jgi:hypothetical protein
VVSPPVPSPPRAALTLKARVNGRVGPNHDQYKRYDQNENPEVDDTDHRRTKPSDPAQNSPTSGFGQKADQAERARRCDGANADATQIRLDVSR